MFELINSWDTSLFLWFNNHHHPFLDSIMWYLSDKLIWIPLYLLFAFYLIRYYKYEAIFIIITSGILITISDQLSVHGFKNVFMRLRPCHEPGLDGLVHLVNNKCGGLYGFYSSHASNHFALSAFLILFLGGKIPYFVPGIFLWAALISYSRIYLGVHYPADVMAGGIMGILLGTVIGKIYLYYRKIILKDQ